MLRARPKKPTYFFPRAIQYFFFLPVRCSQEQFLMSGNSPRILIKSQAGLDFDPAAKQGKLPRNLTQVDDLGADKSKLQLWYTARHIVPL